MKSLAQAKKLGLKTYFGKECKKCGTHEKRLSNNNCVKCSRLKSKTTTTAKDPEHYLNNQLSIRSWTKNVEPRPEIKDKPKQKQKHDPSEKRLEEKLHEVRQTMLDSKLTIPQIVELSGVNTATIQTLRAGKEPMHKMSLKTHYKICTAFGIKP